MGGKAKGVGANPTRPTGFIAGGGNRKGGCQGQFFSLVADWSEPEVGSWMMYESVCCHVSIVVCSCESDGAVNYVAAVTAMVTATVIGPIFIRAAS